MGLSPIDQIRLAVSRASHVASAIAQRRGAPEELLRFALTAAKSVLESDLVVVALVDPSRTGLTVVEATDPALRNLRLPLNGLAGCVVGWDRGEVVPDAATDPRRDELVEKGGLRRTVCVPVRVTKTRGAILAGSRQAGSRERDASDLLLVGLYADLIAVLVAQMEAQRETEAFHERLSLLAARSFERFAGDELDPALEAVARANGVALDKADCDPVLPEIARALRAEAVAVSARIDGCWRIVDSWGLPDDVVRSWSESSDDVARLHREGRFSCVARATGFDCFDQDLRVLGRLPEGAMVLHVLAASSRGAFGPNDLRCAEMAAVRLGWVAHVATTVERSAVDLGGARACEDAEARASHSLSGTLDDLLPGDWGGAG